MDLIIFLFITLNTSFTYCISLNESTLETLANNFKIISKRESRLGKGFELVKGTLIQGFEKIQSNYTRDCMPGSFFYNDTCIFISKPKQKLSWIKAERLCRRLPFNTTFLIFENDHKLDAVRKELVKLRHKEDPYDPLKFLIGFRYKNNGWKWVNDKPLNSTDLKLGKYWNDWSGTDGLCGSISLFRTNRLEMRSTDCKSTSHRFMCEYKFNPCFKSDICGQNGRCINLYMKTYCECTMFYEGKYCEKCK
ncbi:unnamed protein product [Brachionus calyciflorus]|uniref:EGF-like domain-containing protein n=1 Tax=Brachionus calyciflorus TaxID=104777 RepID=A0A813YLL0_9BILA|nr:unnamed protein product [Brachionus calyciflorus]